MKRNHALEVLAEEIRDHAKYMELHAWRDFTGSLVLADFLVGDRVAIWSSASHDDKRGLVLQALRAQGKTITNDDVEAFVDAFDKKYLGGTQIVPPPPTALVEDELRQMAATQRALVVEGLRDAMQAETDAAQAEALAAVDMHKRELNAANKAARSFAQGTVPLSDGADFLVCSSEGNGTVYRITGGACSCPAGLQNKPCRHVALVAAYTIACDRHALALEVLLITRIAAARRQALHAR